MEPAGNISSASIPGILTSDYETKNGNERIFIPATTEGFDFVK